MLIEELSDGRDPCWGEIRKMYFRMLQDVFGDAGFNLGIFYIEDHQVTGFRARVDSIAHVLDRGDSNFRPEIHQVETAHLN